MGRYRFCRWRLFAFVALAAAFAACLGLPRAPRANRAAFEQVREGMTLEQVASTVGGPPGNYSAGWRVPVISNLSWYRDYESWVGADGQLLVLFDEQGKAVRVVIIGEDLLYHPSLVERVRAWLGV